MESPLAVDPRPRNPKALRAPDDASGPPATLIGRKLSRFTRVIVANYHGTAHYIIVIFPDCPHSIATEAFIVLLRVTRVIIPRTPCIALRRTINFFRNGEPALLRETEREYNLACYVIIVLRCDLKVLTEASRIRVRNLNLI